MLCDDNRFTNFINFNLLTHALIYLGLHWESQGRTIISMMVASCRIKATSTSAQRFSIIDHVMNKFLSILEDPFDVALP